MVPRLWVPEIHSLCARNWNLAASGAAFTASRVANSVAVSTPLRIDSLTVAVMRVLLLVSVRVHASGWVGWWSVARVVVRRRRAVARQGGVAPPGRRPRRRG